VVSLVTQFPEVPPSDGLPHSTEGVRFRKRGHGRELWWVLAMQVWSNNQSTASVNPVPLLFANPVNAWSNATDMIRDGAPHPSVVIHEM
jgi:hypothetical protein